MARNYNTEITDAIKTFLDEDDWHYNFENENGVFRFGVALHGKMKNIQLLVGVNEDDYNVYAISPLSADQDDPEQMRQMAEFICRANYGLRDGNFEMDFNDGELRYKCFVNCKGFIPTKDVIGASIHCPAAMFNRYSKGIIQILFNDMSAEDAVLLCEEYLAPPSSCSSNGDEASTELINILRRLQEEETNGDSEDDFSITSAK